MVQSVFDFADEMLGPNGQLNLTLCEDTRYYEKYELDRTLNTFGYRFRLKEKRLMREKYKQYRHVGSKSSDTIIPWIEETGYEHVYVKTGDESTNQIQKVRTV